MSSLGIFRLADCLRFNEGSSVETGPVQTAEYTSKRIAPGLLHLSEALHMLKGRGEILPASIPVPDDICASDAASIGALANLPTPKTALQW